jgi:hypothetical protein
MRGSETLREGGVREGTAPPQHRVQGVLLGRRGTQLLLSRLCARSSQSWSTLALTQCAGANR